MGSPVTHPTPPVGPEVLLLVHGTRVPVENAGPGADPPWYEAGSPFVEQIRKRLGENVKLEIQTFLWDGSNLESVRRSEGRRLLAKLRQLEEQNSDYHLVGHSHGGSIIWQAFEAGDAETGPPFDRVRQTITGAPAETRLLPHLKSWTTVGTPFLHYLPLRTPFVTTAVGVWAAYWTWAVGRQLWTWLRGDGFEFSGPGAIFASSFEHAWGDGQYWLILFFGLSLLAFLATMIPGLFCYPILDARGWWRLRSDTSTRVAWRTFGPKWLGIHVGDDEAIRALQHTLHLEGAIIPSNVPKLFRRLGDNFIWAMLGNRSQGNDTRADRCVAITPGPMLGRLRWPQLPSDDLKSLRDSVDESSKAALQKLRCKLFDSIDPAIRGEDSDPRTPLGLFWEFMNELSWGELFHTSYFPTHWPSSFEGTAALTAVHIAEMRRDRDAAETPQSIPAPPLQTAPINPIPTANRRTRSNRVRQTGAVTPAAVDPWCAWYRLIAPAFRQQFQTRVVRETPPEDRPYPLFQPVRDPVSLIGQANNPYRSGRYAVLTVLASLILASALAADYCIRHLTIYSDEYQIAQITKELPGLLSNADGSEIDEFRSSRYSDERDDVTAVFTTLNASNSPADLLPVRYRRDRPYHLNQIVAEFGRSPDAAAALIFLAGPDRARGIWNELDLAAKLEVAVSFAQVAAKFLEDPDEPEYARHQSLAGRIQHHLSYEEVQRVLEDPAANIGRLRGTTNWSSGNRSDRRSSMNLSVLSMIESQLILGNDDEAARILRAIYRSEDPLADGFASQVSIQERWEQMGIPRSRTGEPVSLKLSFADVNWVGRVMVQNAYLPPYGRPKLEMRMFGTPAQAGLLFSLTNRTRLGDFLIEHEPYRHFAPFTTYDALIVDWNWNRPAPYDPFSSPSNAESPAVTKPSPTYVPNIRVSGWMDAERVNYINRSLLSVDSAIPYLMPLADDEPQAASATVPITAVPAEALEPPLKEGNRNPYLEGPPGYGGTVPALPAGDAEPVSALEPSPAPPVSPPPITPAVVPQTQSYPESLASRRLDYWSSAQQWARAVGWPEGDGRFPAHLENGPLAQWKAVLLAAGTGKEQSGDPSPASELIAVLRFAGELQRRGFDKWSREVATAAESQFGATWQKSDGPQHVSWYRAITIVESCLPFPKECSGLLQDAREIALKEANLANVKSDPALALTLASLLLSAKQPADEQVDALATILSFDVNQIEGVPTHLDHPRILKEIALCRLLARSPTRRGEAADIATRAAQHIRLIPEKQAKVRATLSALLASALADQSLHSEALTEALWSWAAAKEVPSDADRSEIVMELAYVFAQLGELKRAREAAKLCIPVDRLDAYGYILIHTARRHSQRSKTSPAGRRQPETERFTLPTELWWNSIARPLAPIPQATPPLPPPIPQAA